MRAAVGILEPCDLASERWLRGEGGVMDAIRAEMRHRLGLTQREARSGAAPRRAYTPVESSGSREIQRIDALDSVGAVTGPLSHREREALFAWALGFQQVELARRWGVTKAVVCRALSSARRKVGAL